MCPRPEYAKTDPERWERAKAARRKRWIDMMIRVKTLVDDEGMTTHDAIDKVEKEILAGEAPWMTS